MSGHSGRTPSPALTRIGQSSPAQGFLQTPKPSSSPRSNVNHLRPFPDSMEVSGHRERERSIEYQTGSLCNDMHVRGRTIFCENRHSGSCRPSKFVMFQVSGMIGMALFYLAWSDLFHRMQGVPHGPIISWTTAYACSILWQHFLNRTLVWTDLHQGYWESLGGMCLIYLFSLLLSSVLNILFVEVLNITANFAFFLTAVFTGAVNYVAIAKCVEGDATVDEADEDLEGKDLVDPVVGLAANMVSGIQLPKLEMPISKVDLWGKKIKQKAKHWSCDHPN